MRRFALPALAAALAAGGFALGRLTHRPSHDAARYAESRLVAVRQHLREAEPGFVLLVGDSQAELTPPSARVCGAPLVNAGVSGVNAALDAELLSDLPIPVRPRAAVVTIGTNDILRKNDPLSPAVAARFEASVGHLVARLRTVTDAVVVTALPPLDRAVAAEFEMDAVRAYSERIRAACPRLGCTFADPYAALRDGTSGFGLPGANHDGLHLARYRPVLRSLEATLCPGTH